VCAEEINRIPDGIPGVYLIQAAGPAVYAPLYAGKARDLRRRLRQHAEATASAADLVVARRGLATYFSAAPVMSAALRDAIESALIRFFRPPCNRQVPRFDPVYPNLPPSTMHAEEET
jgi:excinuclease UvrABC nuclease subunit